MTQPRAPEHAAAPPHALVFGGTRGLGREIARQWLAQGGSATVVGRPGSPDLHDDLHTHPRLHTLRLDIADAEAVADAMARAGSGQPLALLVVSAGIYFNTRAQALDADTSLRLLRTNVSGLAHVLEAGAARMLAQGHGRMAAVASMAGWLRDYPGASAYAATKRSVIQLCDTYRRTLAPFGIPVTAVVPGYIDTARLRELNGGDARHKPFLMSEAEAARRVLQAVAAGDARCIFPWQMRAAVALLNLLPWMPRLPDFKRPGR